MKKTVLFLLFALAAAGAVRAQNVQVHYDFGSALYKNDLSGRPVVTTTVEMFKPDRWGSTFFFIDMDYKTDGVAAAYWEIARELKFWDGPLSAHVEYNGGLQYVRHAYLAGLTYTANSADYARGFSLSGMYKHIQKQDAGQPHNFQITGTWYVHFAKNRLLTFTGFADFWREKGPHGDYVFLSEPQLWLHFNRLRGVAEGFNLSVGSEAELAYNFAGRKGFQAIPTLALRWDF